jgi:3-dehydroquinate synthase
VSAVAPSPVCEITLRGYRITVAPGLLRALGHRVKASCPAHRYAIITDESVARLHLHGAMASFGAERPTAHVIQSGEQHKTREMWAQVTDELLGAGHGRDSAIVALGGGVVGDLAGFVASTFMRGIPYVQVPTTFLAMVDASIGGKTGVDTPAGKNLVGAFHQPSAVIADPDVLATLPHEQLRAGLAEAVKHGVIADESYFDRIVREAPGLLDAASRGRFDADAWTPIVARSVEIKASVVERDERESGLRKVLNFGHTLGHAIELLSDYRMLHGFAVACGMQLEARLAERLGVSDSSAQTSARIGQALSALGFDVERPAQPAHAVLAATRLDKKSRAGTVEYALPARIGAMAGEENGWGLRIPDELVLEVLA